MCGGGGDGGASERQAATKKEQETAIAAVNKVFGKGDGDPVYGQAIPSEYRGMFPGYDITGYDTTERDANAKAREDLYSTVGADAEAKLIDQLTKDRGTAERGVRFQLARQGLMGGSADIDQGAEILQKYQEGALESRNAATKVQNDTRSADEGTRTNIINNIRNGMSQSDAITSGMAAMTNNANTARDQAASTSIGQFFDDLSLMQARQQYAQGLTSAANGYSNAPVRGVVSNVAGANGVRMN